MALALGAAVGTVNGFFVAFMRLQPIVVTLSQQCYICRVSASLCSTSQAGASHLNSLPSSLATPFPDTLPAVALVLLAALIVWMLIKRSRLGTAIYAVGGDEEAASARGIDVRLTKFLAYVIGGAYYGAAASVRDGKLQRRRSTGWRAVVVADFYRCGSRRHGVGRRPWWPARNAGTLHYTLATIINALLILQRICLLQRARPRCPSHNSKSCQFAAMERTTDSDNSRVRKSLPVSYRRHSAAVPSRRRADTSTWIARTQS